MRNSDGNSQKLVLKTPRPLQLLWRVHERSKSWANFVTGVIRIWRKWLGRRSQSGPIIRWDRFRELLKRYPLPEVKIVHSALKA